MTTTIRSRGAPLEWRWFVAWVLVGCAAVFGAFSFVLVGLAAFAAAVVVAVLMLRHPGVRGSALGLLSGAGLPLVYVAYVQREGPGTTCWHTATSGGCATHLDPIPWLVIGVVLVIAGLALFAPRMLRSRTT
jgi:hypothetical protein